MQKSKIKNFIILSLILIFSFAQAQVKKPFTARYDKQVKGDISIIANNVISRTATGDYNGLADNHDFTDNVYVDIDNDSATFNSSSANFSNPIPGQSCISVIKVYLYWAAADKEKNDGSDNQPNWNYNDVKLMLPGQNTYTTITADEVLYRGRDQHFVNDPYVCVKDITSSVLNLPTPFGKYQIANVEAKIGELRSHPRNGNTGTSGGWQIVFVYESPSLPPKNITLFDGYAHVTKRKNNFNINFTGFHAPPVGIVQADVVIGALEGDRAVTGDKLQIKNVAGTFVDISTSLRSANNFFNSKITSRGAEFIDRTPASLNTLGFDAAIFRLSNPNNTIINNNQTSTTLRMTSNRETYGMYLVGLSVDVWAPNLKPIHLTVTNPGNVNPGGIVSFNFNIFNEGNDDVRNLKLTATIPSQITLVEPINNLPNGVTYTYVNNVLTFFIQDGIADVGSPEINIPFNFLVNDECYFLETSCNLGFDLQFTAIFNGLQNPNQVTTLSSANVDSCGIGDQLPTHININQPVISWLTPADSLDRTIECDDAQGLIDAQALVPQANKCNFTPIKTSGVFVPEANCPNSGTYTNTWTFTDACGVTIASFTQTITVQDTTAPTFNESLPPDVTVECDTVPTAVTLTANDACGTATVTFTETTVAGSCVNNYALTRTWTATDECGNNTTYTQTITVQDTTAPVLSNLPNSEITVACGLVNPPTITATDNCDNNVQLSYQETQTSPDSGGNYVITRTWAFTDACSNESIFVQTVNVNVINITTTVPSIDICVGDIAIDLDSYLVGNTDNNGTWSDDNASGGLSGSNFDPSIVNLGTYQFTYTSSNETCNKTVSIIINVNNNCVVLPCSIEENLVISKVVTLNSDGINDVFKVEGLDGCGFTFDVKIFNRWGKIVFESKDYQNNQKWDGRNFGGLTIGKTNELPSGTYYYIINIIGSGVKPRTGYIYLGR